MKKLCSIFLAFILLSGFLSAGSSVVTPQTETVTANLAAPGSIIPNNFVGFSIEEADVIGGNLFQGTTGSNASMLSILQLLGSHGYIRIGANSQDCPINGCSTAYTINSTQANNVASFFSALGSGWSLSWGLNLRKNDPTAATTMVGTVLTAFSGNSNPLMFSIGNEPDLYGITEAQYQTNWNSYYTALSTAYPSIVIEAAETSNVGHQGWITGLDLTPSQLALVTTHSYMGANINMSQFKAIISNATGTSFSGQVSFSNNNYRLGECGIDYEGGINNVSNALISSAWFLDMAINLANAGAVGITPHSVLTASGQTAQPFPNLPLWSDFVLQGDGNWLPQARFYGEYLFSKIEGQQIVSTSTSGTGSVSAISTTGTGGNANILVVNNNTLLPVTVTPAQSNSWSTANVYVIAPTNNGFGCADTNPTLNSVSFGESGAWSGSAKTISNGGTVTIQPCGAALIQIQP